MGERIMTGRDFVVTPELRELLPNMLGDAAVGTVVELPVFQPPQSNLPQSEIGATSQGEQVVQNG